MKKKWIQMIAAGLCFTMLVGCQETPKDSIIKQKGASNIKNYESEKESNEEPERTQESNDTEETEKKEELEISHKKERKKGRLWEAVGAPEHYKNQASYQQGALVIDTDAEVILPEGDFMNTYTVSAKPADQALLDRVTQTFFEDGRFYIAYNYDKWTRQIYQEQITRLKKYKAEGNLDPYDYGQYDDGGGWVFDIDQKIASYEEEIQGAPEEIAKEEVHPSFGLEYWDDQGEEITKVQDSDYFAGVAETKDGIFNYHISNSLAPDISFKIEKRRAEIEDPELTSKWKEGEYAIKWEGDSTGGISEEQAMEYIDISYEEAEQIAKEKVDQLGWDMQVYDWDYAFCHTGRYEIKPDNVLDGGYLFHFTKVLDEAPITYTSSYGGGLEDMDSTLVPWSYERCEVIVGDGGIQKVEIYNPYDVGGIQTEHVKLMSFDEIIKIYEQMMEISNSDLSIFKNMTYHIKKITLGYSRIYDPNTDSDTGLLVPVWDFFGASDYESDDYSETDPGEHSTQSYLTINAIDGTVIDRGLGY